MFSNKELIDILEEKINVSKIFVESETITAKHELFKSFQKDYPNIPKIIFYILMQNKFGFGDGKDINNDIGYYLSQKRVDK